MGNSETINRRRIHSILPLFIISPLLSLPFLIRDIKKGHYYALYYLAFFMSLLAYLWTPSGDLYRLYEEYERIKTMSFGEVLEISVFDYVANILMFLLSKTGLNFEWYRLLQCFICYSLIFSVIKDIVDNNKYANDPNVKFEIFLVFFGLLQFGTFLTGSRFPFSTAMMIYGMYKVFYKNHNLSVFWMVLAGLCHYSFWPVLVMTLFCMIFKPTFPKHRVLLLIVIFCSVSSILMLLLIDYMNFGDVLMAQLDNYTTGYFANGELADRSLKYLVLTQVTRLPFYLVIIYAITRIKEFSKCQLFVCLLLFSILLVNMNTAFGRYSYLTTISLLPFLLLNEDKYFRIKHLKILCYLSVFVFAFSVYGCKRELKLGKQYLIMTPIPYILSQEYSERWITDHINPDGSMIGID